MANDYSEDNLIQKSTSQLLEEELGWKSIMGCREDWCRWHTGQTKLRRGAVGAPLQGCTQGAQPLDHRSTDRGSRGANDGTSEQSDADADKRTEILVYPRRRACDTAETDR